MEAKCGSWPACGGAVCRDGYHGYCLARAKMTGKADPRMWGYSKTVPPPTPVVATGPRAAAAAVEWGAHRATVAVHAAGAKAPAVGFVEIHWRRRDVRPEAKNVLVAHRSATGRGATAVQVHNRVVLSFNGSTCRVLFDAALGPG